MEGGGWLSLSNTNIQLSPGDSEELEIRIKNSSRWIKDFKIHVSGIEPQWYDVSIPETVLFPNEESVSILTITVPPVASKKSAVLNVAVSSTGDGGVINDLAMTPDGSRVITGMDDGSIHVLNFESGVEERIIKTSGYPVKGVTLTPDGTRLFIGSNDGTLRMLNFESGAEERVIRTDNRSISGLAMTPDGTHLIIGMNDKPISVFDLRSRQEERSIKCDGFSVQGVAILPEGDRIVVGGDDQTLRVLNFAPGEVEPAVLALTEASIKGVAVTPDGNFLVTGSDDGEARVLDFSRGQEQRVIETSEIANVTGRIEIQPPEDQTIQYEVLRQVGSPNDLKLSGSQEAAAQITLRNDSSWPEAFSVSIDGLPDKWTGHLFLGDDEQGFYTQDSSKPYSLIPVPSNAEVILGLTFSMPAEDEKEFEKPRTVVISFMPHLNIGTTKSVLIELEPV